ADKRIFPAVDINASGTRREEWLLSAQELKIMWKLRRVMAALDQQQAIELLMGKLRDTSSNAEFLLTVQKTTPGMGSDCSHGRAWAASLPSRPGRFSDSAWFCQDGPSARRFTGVVITFDPAAQHPKETA